MKYRERQILIWDLIYMWNLKKLEPIATENLLLISERVCLGQQGAGIDQKVQIFTVLGERSSWGCKYYMITNTILYYI